MGAINIKKEEWPDIVVSFLLDKMIKDEKIIGENERFNELAELMEKRGMKPFFLHYYMSSSATVRSKYKILDDSFVTGKSTSGRVSIDAGKAIEKEKESGMLKSLIKKALKLVVAHKKRSGFPLSEEKVDKILDDLLVKEGILEEKE